MSLETSPTRAVAETVTTQDRFFDYAYHEYVPSKPAIGKLRSCELLIRSFEVANHDRVFYELVRRIQDTIGLNRTVWGAKQAGGKLSWEFYFYDYRKVHSELTMSSLIEIVRSFFHCKVRPNENLPYIMFSIDLDSDLLNSLHVPGFHIYTVIDTGHPTGFSYYLSPSGTRLENHYTFYKMDNEIEAVLHKVKSSVFVDFSVLDPSEILLPGLTRCRHICIANKQTTDCIYYSGIDIQQFLFFLRRFEFPEGLVSFVESDSDRLDHLQYDVGFDYTMEQGRLKITKCGFYGTF